MERSKLKIRLLERGDIPQIAEAFAQLGWNKPAPQYQHYLMEQGLKLRDVYVAFVETKFAGYLTICWKSTHEPFYSAGIPEIVDFNILPEFRRQHIGTALMDKAESEIAKRSRVAGIGVGMTPDYGAAQRLYVLRGYVPDGRGLFYRNHQTAHAEQVSVDDDLVLYFTKELKSIDGE